MAQPVGECGNFRTSLTFLTFWTGCLVRGCAVGRTGWPRTCNGAQFWWLWYLNLKVFGLFQRSHEASAGYIDIAGFQLFGIALPIFVAACIGLLRNSRLLLAISTQFAAGYPAFLLLAWQTPGPSNPQASLRVIATPSGAGFYLMAAILGACVLSCVISHLLYLRAKSFLR